MIVKKCITTKVDDKLIVHSYVSPISQKMVLNKAEASLLLIELTKFLKGDKRNRK